MKLTKQAINKLLKAEPKVTLFNGCFNEVTAVAEFSKYKVELTVEVTHKVLTWQCGDRKDVRLVYWRGCSGTHMDIDPLLLDKIEDMRKIGVMLNDDARELSMRNAKAFSESFKELGL